ncbi:MAG: hypothetical protein LPK46_08605 [Bacteroidota bacterium]|nr:hypothetical protein [Bacteroidota bacterium]
MNTERLIQLFQNPHLIGERETDQLRSMLEDLPYSPFLHLLYVRGLKNQKSYLLHDAIKKAALRLPDRRILFDWIEKGEPVMDVMEGGKTDIVVAPPSIEKTEEIAEVEESVNFTPEKEAPSPEPEKTTPPKVEEVPHKEVVEVSQENESNSRSEMTPKEKIPVTVSKVDTQVSEPTPPSQPEPDTPAKATSTESLGPTSLDDLDLSALPERVRAIILKSRQIKDNIKKPTPEPELPSAPDLMIKPKIREEPIVEDKVEPPTEMPETKDRDTQETVLEPEPTGPSTPERSIPEREVQKQEEPRIGSSNEVHSFAEWINLRQTSEDKPVEENVTEPIQEVSEETKSESEQVFATELQEDQPSEVEDEVEKESPGPRKKELIERFIEKNPSFKPKKEEREPINMVELSYVDESAYVTETLAKIYVEQKHYDRAINAYEILRLKYPEKSSFFADRIESVKKLKHKK